MKIEIEVTESEIKDALARHVRTAVADRVNAWGSQQKLKDIVAAEYERVTREIVIEALKDSAKIKQQVHDALVTKIRGQLTAALRKEVGQ